MEKYANNTVESEELEEGELVEEEEVASEEVEVQSAEARERAWKTKRNQKKKMKRKNRLKRKLLGLMSGTRGESPQIKPSSNVNPPTDKITNEEENKQKN